MAKSIRISKKHGVNPTIPTCFWCGKAKNEVALLGQLPGDKEAPMHTLLDYEPCDNCKAKMAQGITCIEVTEKPTATNMAIAPNLYPTGSWAVVKPSALDAMINDPGLIEDIKDAGRCVLSQETFRQLFPGEDVDNTAPSRT